jgi:hypothetical protein
LVVNREMHRGTVLIQKFIALVCSTTSQKKKKNQTHFPPVEF